MSKTYQPVITPEELAKAQADWANTYHPGINWKSLAGHTAAAFGGAAAAPALAGALGVGGAAGAAGGGAMGATGSALTSGLADGSIVAGSGLPAAAAAAGGGSSLAGPAIQGGTAVVGGLFGKHAANKATDTQAKAAAEALALQKDNEMQRRKEYADMIAAQKAQWDAKEARLAPIRSLQEQELAKYAATHGLNLGNLSSGATPYAPGGATTMATGSSVQPASLASLLGSGGLQGGQGMISPSQPNNLGSVFDWSQSVGGA